MNKRTQIGLILVITLILLLGLTIPSMAKPNPPWSCHINPLIENKDGEIVSWFLHLFGDLEKAGWEGDTLVNICTGTVPFGDAINPMFSYAEFETYCEAELGECNEVGTIYTLSDEGIGTVYDPDARVTYTADTRTFTLYDDGNFVFEKYYTLISP